MIAAAATLAFLGFKGSFSTLMELVLIAAILAFSGYVVIAGGTFSFAFVAFIGIGAYTGAILTVDHGTNLLVPLLVSPLIAMAVAAVLAKPLERLSGVYLALVSVAIISVLRVVLLNLTDLTGGAIGISGIPSTIKLPQLLVAVGLLALGFWLVQRSMVGRAMRLMRADPLVAESMGIDVQRLRFWLFLASAALGAVGGVLRASYFGFVVPGDYGFPMLIRILAIVILGGVGHWSAPIVGAAVWTLLPEWLRPLGHWREVVTGVVLLLIILLLPQGITGGVEDSYRRLLRRLKHRHDDDEVPAATNTSGSTAHPPPSLAPDVGAPPATAGESS
ncbi:MAG: branched-chain amino acid ABC transporter permease [Acidimicrobiia bacterium]